MSYRRSVEQRYRLVALLKGYHKRLKVKRQNRPLDVLSPYLYDIPAGTAATNGCQSSEGWVSNKLELIDEHSKLVNKKFGGGLDVQEEDRLLQIREEIDRIEEEQYGSNLAKLEAFVEDMEALGDKVKALRVATDEPVTLDDILHTLGGEGIDEDATLGDIFRTFREEDKTSRNENDD